jgi:CheY-specific phosphatase CheX
MRKEYLLPFIKASQIISEKFFRVDVKKSEYILEKNLSLEKDVIIALGIKKDLTGIALFGLSYKDAAALSKHVLNMQGMTKEMAKEMGMSDQEWKELNESVLKEFGNLVVGYVTELYGAKEDENGNPKQIYKCDITTPWFITKEKLKDYKNNESIRFELMSDIANMTVKLHIQKN